MARTEPEPAARRAARAASILAVATAASVGLVALVHDRALPRIEASQRAERLRALTGLLGVLAFDNDPLTDVVELRDAQCLGTADPQAVHRARRGGVPVAVLINTVAPDGYAGALRLLVAVDAQGRLLGVRVQEHRETPGLGDFVEESRSDWIHQFAGRSLGDPPPARWQVGKDGGDFDHYTGATVTSRAVTHAVRDALACFAKHRAELLAEPPSRDTP